MSSTWDLIDWVWLLEIGLYVCFRGRILTHFPAQPPNSRWGSEPKQRRRQREWQKSNRFRWAKQQLCTCITLFGTFLGRECTTTTWKYLIHLNTKQRVVRRILKRSLFLVVVLKSPWIRLRSLKSNWNSLSRLRQTPVFYKIRIFCRGKSVSSSV